MQPIGAARHRTQVDPAELLIPSGLCPRPGGEVRPGRGTLAYEQTSMDLFHLGKGYPS
jgi:hypothetical protein